MSAHPSHKRLCNFARKHCNWIRRLSFIPHDSCSHCSHWPLPPPVFDVLLLVLPASGGILVVQVTQSKLQFVSQALEQSNTLLLPLQQPFLLLLGVPSNWHRLVTRAVTGTPLLWLASSPIYNLAAIYHHISLQLQSFFMLLLYTLSFVFKVMNVCTPFPQKALQLCQKALQLDPTTEFYSSWLMLPLLPLTSSSASLRRSSSSLACKWWHFSGASNTKQAAIRFTSTWTVQHTFTASSAALLASAWRAFKLTSTSD